MEQTNIARAAFERDAEALQKTLTISYWSTITSVIAVLVSAIAVVVSLSNPTVIEVHVDPAGTDQPTTSTTQVTR